MSNSLQQFPSLSDDRARFRESDVFQSVIDHIGHLYKNVVQEPDTDTAYAFFYNLTDFMSLLEAMRLQMDAELAEMVNLQLNQLSINFILAAFCTVIALFLTPPFTIFYVYSNDALTKRMQSFVLQLQSQDILLNAEKVKSENLLKRMMPSSVAKILTSTGSYKPETYDSVTVYFSDIEGFDIITESISPTEIVTLLNEVYSIFDNITDNHDVYKVETIGDSYMLASGIPVRNNGKHAEEIAKTALEIRNHMKSYRLPHSPTEKLHLICGAHTGPCAAAVVGQKMPRYCIFGDTVNTASRMMTSGLRDRCHISTETKKTLELFQRFEFEFRGPTFIKGKGVLSTWWLIGESNAPQS